MIGINVIVVRYPYFTVLVDFSLLANLPDKFLVSAVTHTPYVGQAPSTLVRSMDQIASNTMKNVHFFAHFSKSATTSRMTGPHSFSAGCL